MKENNKYDVLGGILLGGEISPVRGDVVVCNKKQSNNGQKYVVLCQKGGMLGLSPADKVDVMKSGLSGEISKILPKRILCFGGNAYVEIAGTQFYVRIWMEQK